MPSSAGFSSSPSALPTGLLPRKRNPALPLGYREAPGLVAVARSSSVSPAASPASRSSDRSRERPTLSLLAASAILQVVAVVLFVIQLWPRIYGRNKLGHSLPGRREAPDGAKS